MVRGGDATTNRVLSYYIIFEGKAKSDIFLTRQTYLNSHAHNQPQIHQQPLKCILYRLTSRLQPAPSRLFVIIRVFHFFGDCVCLSRFSRRIGNSISKACDPERISEDF